MSGPLKNSRHERFAQGLARGEPASAAYVAAGYRPSEPNASRLTRNDKVAARVMELQKRAAERTEITVESVTKRLLAIADKGEKMAGGPGLSVARAALMDAAKLNGLVIDRTQRELSDDQMKLILDMIAKTPGLAQQLLAQIA